MATTDQIEVPKQAPFGLPIFWGKKGSGKTLLGLNSPWLPIHTIDTELSSKDYFIHQKRLIDMGYLKNEFTRAECLSLPDVVAEMTRIKKANEHYGTILIDTAGQWSEWVANDEHTKAVSDKIAQIVWGKIRDRLRRSLLDLSSHCDCLIMTAHERKYGSDISPRCNPALLEVSAMSIRIVRDPNKLLPVASFIATRIPFFPPSISDFTLMKMLPYFGNPADWTKLSDDDMIPEEPGFVGNPDEEN